MDTRPWRLDIPQGIVWFEVDRSDVLKAKQAELRRAGVPFTRSQQAAQSFKSDGRGGQACRHSSNSGDHRTSQEGASRETYSLKVDSWRSASADLQVPGWLHPLLAAGLDLKQPVLWMAEGLLYYLEPETVGPMLQVSVGAPVHQWLVGLPLVVVASVLPAVPLC